jgi:hypothetical protein
MNRLLFLPDGFANRPARGVARCFALARGAFRTATRYADDRKAARRAKREQRCSEMKLTDEMERKIAQRFMQNRGFRL